MRLTATPLTAAAIEERIDQFLQTAVFSRRRPTIEAEALAGLTALQQDFALHWGEAIAKTCVELAYPFFTQLPKALRRLETSSIERWVIRAMDHYDTLGQGPAFQVFRELDRFVAEEQTRRHGIALAEVSRVLEGFLRGLNGRTLRLAPGDAAYTDTETLFLPDFIGHLPNREDNFRLYKALATHLWAQTWYGTWRGGIAQNALAQWTDHASTLAWFHALERVRLDACLARQLPGLHREMQRLRTMLELDPTPDPAIAFPELQAPTARVNDVLALLPRCVDRPPPSSCCYQGVLRPDRVMAVWNARVILERRLFRILLANLIEERDGQPPDTSEVLQEPLEETRERFAAHAAIAPDAPQGVTWELLLDGQPVMPPSDFQPLVESLMQDLGGIPPDYLVAAGPGLYRTESRGAPSGTVSDGPWQEADAIRYPEWDHDRGHYRKNWCSLRELPVRVGNLDFYQATLARHGGLIHSLHRTFEALRGEDCILRRQPQGEDVDIDALVETLVDHQAGLEMSDRVFLRLSRDKRHVAAAFLVDLSGSTRGWINQAEREALILLAESLETLGDQYAIYGFSGWTRTRCEVFRIKTFDEPYNDVIKGRIGAIEPRDYTRMGPAIRHVTRQLAGIEARTRLLVTLSDGKPDDFDPNYRGTYGIEDTRMALFEARCEGIHPFCVTIDREGADYLPRLYGPAHYVVLDEVAKLPLKLSDIYRRLTT